jgi:hypothetical protein
MPLFWGDDGYHFLMARDARARVDYGWMKENVLQCILAMADRDDRRKL